MIERLPRFLRRWVRRLRDLPTRFREYPELKQALGAQAAKQLCWSAFRYPIGDYRDGAGPLATVLLPNSEGVTVRLDGLGITQKYELGSGEGFSTKT